MATIPATNPVTVPGTGSVTYNQWFLTQLIAKIDPNKAPIIVHLTRATNASGSWQLMPRGTGSEVSFTLDAWDVITNDATAGPLVNAAIEAITAAVIAYGQEKNLL